MNTRLLQNHIVSMWEPSEQLLDRLPGTLTLVAYLPYFSLSKSE